MTDPTTILGRGVYLFADAAKLTGLSTRRVREWFVGRKAAGRQPVFTADYPPEGNVHAISFRDLVDVFVAGQLREHGVSLRTVRKVYARLAEDLGTPHPFCRRELLTDGKEVFVRGLDKHGEEEVYEALTKQKAFPTLILPFLKQLDYDPETVLAARWRIADGVVVDPRYCFGRPVLVDAVIQTYILAAAHEANGKDPDKVADWYGVTPEEVQTAVRFEAGLSA